MTRGQMLDAQKTLRTALEQLLGPQLDGIAGFGARLDLKTRQMALDVVADGADHEKLAAGLPERIDGLPVRVRRGGPARFDGID